MKRIIGYVLVVGLPLLFALIVAAFDPPPLPRVRELVFDTYQKLQPRQYDPDLPVRIVAVDEKSIRELGQTPWPRTTMADLTKNLAEAGAAAIAFDIGFDQPDRSSLTVEGNSTDERFAQALREAPSVLAFFGVSDPRPPFAVKSGFATAGDDSAVFIPHFAGAVVPIPILLDTAHGLGAVNWVPDGDQVVRKVPTVITAGGALAPSLAIEALRIAQGVDTLVIKGSNASGELAFGQAVGVNTLKVGELEVDTDPSGEMRLYARRSKPDVRISAVDVIRGQFDPNEVRGRIVFVGYAAIALGDYISTPVENALPGIEVHAQIAEQVLAGTYLVRPDWITGLEIVLIGILGVALAIFLRLLRSHPLLSIGIGLLIPFALVIGSWLLFSYQRLLMDPVMPTVSSLALVLAATAWHFRESEQRRDEIRGIFGRFVTPAVVEQLVSHPDRIVLGGEIRPLTLLFSDVRGFTDLAENRDPTEVVSLVRSIHTPTTEAVLRHGGTIDKYIGDGMMAFWNAPLNDPDHAAHACLAALDIIAFARSFKKPPLSIGVGLHTGDACVGNIGSEQRLEYSALGDNVNLAARVEQLTKTFHVDILATEATQEAAPGFAFLEVERVRVKGRRGVTALYALHSASVDQAFWDLQKRHQSMLEAYRKSDVAAMSALLESAAGLYDPVYNGLLSYYRSRAEWLRTEGADGWDGIHTLDHK